MDQVKTTSLSPKRGHFKIKTSNRRNPKKISQTRFALEFFKTLTSPQKRKKLSASKLKSSTLIHGPKQQTQNPRDPYWQSTSRISEEDLEELESDLHKMAEKILEYRSTIPDQLKTTLDSILSTQRPNFPGIDDGSEPGPSGEHNADSEEMELDKERRSEERIRLLKEKISNISAMPVVLKRMKDCISRFEKLDSCNGIIHPAFKKRKLVDPMKVDFKSEI